MRLWAWRTFSLGCILGLTALPLAGQTERTEAPRYVRVAEQRADGVVLTVDVAAEDVRVDLDASGRSVVALPGAGNETRPGYPELPLVVTSIAVPEGAELRLRVDADETLERTIAPLRPAPLRERVADASGSSLGGDRVVYRPEPAIYQQAGAWPEERVTIEEVRYRGLRIARLVIRPIRYRPQFRTLEHTPHMQVSVEFVGGSGYPSGPDPDRRSIERLLANHDSMHLRREAPRARGAAPSSPARAKGAAGPPGVKILVSATGLVRVSGGQLAAAGLNIASIDPQRLEVSYRNQPIPCRVIGEGDGVFATTDAVEFYAERVPSRYVAETVYWLEQQDEPGLRFPTRAAPPGSAPLASSFMQTVKVEDENTIYSLGRPAQDGDPHFFWKWFEENPNPPRITAFTDFVNIDNPVAGGQAAFRASLWGRTDVVADPDHHLSVRIETAVTHNEFWDGIGFHDVEFSFDSGILADQQIRVQFFWENIAFPDSYLLDYYELEYPRSLAAVDDVLSPVASGGLQRWQITQLVSVTDALLLDVSNPLAPVELTGWTTGGSPGARTLSFEENAPADRRYHVVGDSGRVAVADLVLDVPSNLRDTANGADMLVVVPDGWESRIQSLVDYRRSQGLRVVMANLTDVADEFAGGNADDVAVRDFVAYAYHNWQPPTVRFLLLVGEPNLDPLNWLGEDSHDHLMPIHFATTSAQGETISDTWFGAVDGADLLPDVHVGRFSADLPLGAENQADKSVNYEMTAPGSSWTNDVLAIASSDAAFENSLDNAMSHLPNGFVVHEEFRRAGATTESMISSMNAGRLMINFIGHGNIGAWADNPGTTFLRGGDLNSMVVQNRSPFVIALNCLNGQIADPIQGNSLSESFHDETLNRAVGVWSSSALGFLSQYDPIQEVFYQRAFEDRLAHFGEFTSGALVEAYLTRPLHIDIVKEVLLLGDPATILAVPCDSSLQDVFCNGRDDDCDGQIDEDWVEETTSCGLGACAAEGASQCVNGLVFDTCVPGAPGPADDVCDGIDQDCDGLVDENVRPLPTSCGVGECLGTGLLKCVNAELVDSCEPGAEPEPEVCDGLDNDCDGNIDQGLGDPIDTDFDGIFDFCDPDDDNDGALDGDDCAPLAAGVSVAAGPIGDSLRIGKIGVAKLEWLPGAQGHTSNVYRGSLDPQQPWDYATACLAPERASHSVLDSAVPTPETLFFYLVSARNVCGESRIGAATGPVDLFPSPSCPTSSNDVDADGRIDLADNCALVPNADQLDVDGDFVGEACDNCPAIANDNQANTDGDAFGDACDDCVDPDGDGFGTPGFASATCAEDNCPALPNPDQADADGDGAGDVCDPCRTDPDVDGDLVCDLDNCPEVVNPSQRDADGDGVGDRCDTCTDLDGDGWGNEGFPENSCGEDNCPSIANPDQTDTDGDGDGDPCDACPLGDDPDGDGICGVEFELKARSPMRFLANVSAPGIGEAWTGASFNDGAWTAGIFGVGYETAGGAGGLINTAVTPGSASVYTRASFDVDYPIADSRVYVGADYDDGFAIWLNGGEIYRAPELGSGPLQWDTPAASHESSNGVQPDYGPAIDVSATASALLLQGENVLAIGVWNDVASSPDLVVVPLVLVRVGVDNCPTVSNSSQQDSDGDGRGDACD